MADKYHEDYERKITDIRNNISTCTQTSPAERRSFLKAIDVVTSSKVGKPEKSTLETIERSIRNIAHTRGLLLKGTKRNELSNQDLWHTTPSIRFELKIGEIALSGDPDLALDATSLGAKIRGIIDKLQSPSMFAIQKAELGGKKLQATAQPLWLGDPKTSTPPIATPADFPACAGLAPTTGTHYCLVVQHMEPLLPRFADSGGYPYWRPGGRTLPIPESPYKIGIFEAIVGDLGINMLAAPISDFYRST